MAYRLFAVPSRADDDALRVFGNVSLMLILEIRPEEKILVAVRLAPGRIAEIVNQFLARLDADKLRLVVALILLAVEKPKFRYLRRVLCTNLVVIRNGPTVRSLPSK